MKGRGLTAVGGGYLFSLALLDLGSAKPVLEEVPAETADSLIGVYNKSGAFKALPIAPPLATNGDEALGGGNSINTTCAWQGSLVWTPTQFIHG